MWTCSLPVVSCYKSLGQRPSWEGGDWLWCRPTQCANSQSARPAAQQVLCASEVHLPSKCNAANKLGPGNAEGLCSWRKGPWRTVLRALVSETIQALASWRRAWPGGWNHSHPSGVSDTEPAPCRTNEPESSAACFPPPLLGDLRTAKLPLLPGRLRRLSAAPACSSPSARQGALTALRPGLRAASRPRRSGCHVSARPGWAAAWLGWGRQRRPSEPNWACGSHCSRPSCKRLPDRTPGPDTLLHGPGGRGPAALQALPRSREPEGSGPTCSSALFVSLQGDRASPSLPEAYPARGDVAVPESVCGSRVFPYQVDVCAWRTGPSSCPWGLRTGL